MSTPSEKNSSSATSPLTVGGEFEDTASSVQGMGAPPLEVTVQQVQMNAPPSPPVQVVPVVPNATFKQSMARARARSASPRPRRVVSPSISVAQSRARTAERKADTALSSAGQIAAQTLRAQSTAEDAIAEARTVRKEVADRISEIAQRTEDGTASVLGNLVGQVQQAAERTKAQASRAVGTTVQ